MNSHPPGIAMSLELPLISVVIACYNYERYVAEALESVLSQGYPALEVIAVNDGSSDGSLAILRRYADRVLVIDKPNGGHISAVNRGFEDARGALVYFLDADDRLEPGALERVALAYRPECSKVQFDLRIIDGEGRDLGRRFCYFGADYDQAWVRRQFDTYGTYRWPVTPGNFYARRFLEQVFPLQIPEGPDGVLNTIAPLYGEVAVIPEALGAYRLHGKNRWATKGNDEGLIPSRIAFRRRELETLALHALRLGIALPAFDPLDHELPSINYRLMALRLGQRYDGSERDSPFRLLELGLETIRDDRYPLPMALAHATWLCAMVGLPKSLAASLIQLRFNRAALVQAVRSRLKGELSDAS